MWEILTNLNHWIVSHKELVTLVAVPSVTFLVTKIVNNFAEKRALDERQAAEERATRERRLQLELSRRMKLAEFRQNWINQLRDDFAVILSVVPSESASDAGHRAEVNKRIHAVLLRMNPKERPAKDIFDVLMKLLNDEKSNKEEIAFDLTNLVNAYLKTEWDRLKQELEDYQKWEASI